MLFNKLEKHYQTCFIIKCVFSSRRCVRSRTYNFNWACSALSRRGIEIKIIKKFFNSSLNTKSIIYSRPKLMKCPLSLCLERSKRGSHIRFVDDNIKQHKSSDFINNNLADSTVSRSFYPKTSKCMGVPCVFRLNIACVFVVRVLLGQG